MPARTLLLNWVYYYPVGHAVEAFKTAKGLAEANPGLEIHVLLNSRTPVELAEGCDWIARAYVIDVDEFAEGENEGADSLREVPAEWDYVVDDHRVTTSPFSYSQPLRNFHNVAGRRFKARLWKGGQHLLRSEAGAPGYQANATIRMRVPALRQSGFVDGLPAGRLNIAVLPAGSGHEAIYPGVEWWERAIQRLSEEFEGAHFFLTGKCAADERSSTLQFSRSDVDRLTGASSRVFDCFDVGLWNQVALLEWCDLLIAPHTGFAFLAPSVGTPWLSISGVRWPECYFNEVPFYCVLPECGEYPCWPGMKSECVERLAGQQRPACMAEELEGRIPDLVEGSRLLLGEGFPFERAMALHEERVGARFARERFFRIE